VIRAVLAPSETATSNTSSAAAPGASSGAAEFGLTVTMGMPLVTVALTEYEPAKTDCVVETPPPSPGWTSTASVIRPDSVLMARRAATSLPAALDGMSTAAGEVFSTSCASISACGATRKSVTSADSTR